ncbi:MAG: phosphoribosylformylglycinamidine cyclo-ligase [bacterium]
MAGITYKGAGVNIDTATEALKQVKELVRSTYRPTVLGDTEGFGGLISLDVHKYRKPVLVSSIDGVGTKLKVAFLAGKHDTVGIDLLSHCANDILVQGAQPLFFLDYFATGKLIPDVMVAVVKGLAQGCRQVGCVLIGGETAEMPDFYRPGEYDLAGAMVGVVEKEEIIDGSRIRMGDRLLGLGSNGLHTNGYSLVRKILFDIAGYSVDTYIEELGATLGAELLRTHRCYTPSVSEVLKRFDIRGLAHITGGGLLDNIPRILPEGCSVRIDPSTWEVPPIFELVRSLGQIEEHEMYRTFNMGIGMVVFVDPGGAEDVAHQFQKLGEQTYQIGEVIGGPREVQLVK